MSKYTTGEIAKLCGVSVRTVQYYDSREILVPEELTEGGRRLYSEDDLNKLKIICFLREIGMPIKNIGELFSEEHPENVLSILLDEQARVLRKERDERQEQLDKLEQMKRGLKCSSFSLESIGDIAYQMKNKKKLRKLHGLMLAIGIVMDIIEIAAAVYWWQTGIWWPFALGMGIVVILGVWITLLYFRNTAYICPQCHAVFKPALKNVIFAHHTPKTRKLTCTQCGYKGYCVEVYDKKKA